VASTIFAKSDCVNVYDTMFARLDAETQTTIKRIFGLKSVEGLRMVDMQYQEGTSDLACLPLLSLHPFYLVRCCIQARQLKGVCFTAGKLSLFPKNRTIKHNDLKK